MQNRTLVLNHTQIQQKIVRIAHQIYENNAREKELILVGIAPRGNILAERIAAILRDISPLVVKSYSLSIDKDKPLSKAIECALTAEEAKNNVLILVDDVLNTGKALIYACRYLLEFEEKSLQTVTLIDRRHRNYPVRADYVGLTLATTLQEHISIEFGKEDSAWLI
jgi:pyrimidine operon attenuation protein / uracil phosphoribosyltransferase